MNVEQRLHQAAHEIREIQVEVPTFVAPPSSEGAVRRAVPILAVSMMMALGLAAFASRSSDVSTLSAEPPTASVLQLVTPPEPAAAAGDLLARQLTPREEVAMIASLGGGPGTSMAQLSEPRVPTGVT